MSKFKLKHHHIVCVFILKSYLLKFVQDNASWLPRNAILQYYTEPENELQQTLAFICRNFMKTKI